MHQVSRESKWVPSQFVWYDQAFYYWLGRVLPSVDKFHHIYTRDEMWNMLYEHGTYGPWELAIEF
jgi:hypothetical protein